VTFFAICTFAAVLLAGAVAALMVQLLPYIIIGMVIGVVVRRRRHRAASEYRPQVSARSERPVTASGWVYLAVWVGPPPRQQMPVIDAEVIEDHRRG